MSVPHCLFFFNKYLFGHYPKVGGCSITQSCPTLCPHGLQHTSLPCPPCLLKCMSIESVMPSKQLILCRPLLLPSIFPSIRSFPVSRLFTSGGQSIGASASATVLPMNIQGWFPLGLTGLISLLSKGLSRVFSNTTVQKHKFFRTQTFLLSNSHIHTWLLEKPQLWLDWPLQAK